MLNIILRSLVLPFRPARPVPPESRKNFLHLYLDIAWFGILSGTILAFLNIYSARIGATAEQIGLITAAPGLVNLLLALPAGIWLEKQPTRLGVFWSAVISRSFYWLLLLIPAHFSGPVQIWLIISLTLVMSVPGVGLAVGFNALLAETVEAEWRGYVVGIRNACLALTTAVSTIVSGYILSRLAFPTGYQVVFLIGVIGAMMSCVHLWLVKPINESQNDFGMLKDGSNKRELAEKQAKSLLSSLTSTLTDLRPEILRGEYGKVILLLSFLHFAHYLPSAVFSVYTVNYLKYTDQVIGIAAAIFYVFDFIASLQLDRISSRLSNQKVTALGMIMMSAYPFIIRYSYHPWLYFLANIIAGAAWAFISGALYNYLLEKVPANDRPAYLAWYNVFFNGAVLLGAIGGPIVAEWISIPNALLFFALLRFLAGSAIFRWG